MHKKCFTMISCNLRNKCLLGNIQYNNGYFNPRDVGEFCDSFIPILDNKNNKMIIQNQEESYD